MGSPVVKLSHWAFISLVGESQRGQWRMGSYTFVNLLTSGRGRGDSNFGQFRTRLVYYILFSREWGMGREKTRKCKLGKCQVMMRGFSKVFLDFSLSFVLFWGC